MKTRIEKFGALGNWEKIDECTDKSIIKQINDASCVSAVGEMLARYYGLNLSQEEILTNINVLSNAKNLAAFLNFKVISDEVEWYGGFFPPDSRFTKGLNQSVQVWAAMLRDGEALGHAVLITGEDENELVIIKDLFDQTTYKMTERELFRVLSEFVLRRKKK